MKEDLPINPRDMRELETLGLSYKVKGISEDSCYTKLGKFS